MAPRSRPTVLVVEDEALLRLIIVDELQEAGFDVVEASDGSEALDALNSCDGIDLLFTDIRMPGPLNGWDVAEQARNMRPGIPVIYATGFSEAAPRIASGIDDLSWPVRLLEKTPAGNAGGA